MSQLRPWVKKGERPLVAYSLTVLQTRKLHPSASRLRCNPAPRVGTKMKLGHPQSQTMLAGGPPGYQPGIGRLRSSVGLMLRPCGAR